MTHCTPLCNSKRHIYQLNAVVQNGTLDQAKACVATCHHALRGFDINGRNLLHVASANGKDELIKWLLEKTKSALNTKDKESGWTALHRAIFYGQICSAVTLLQYGAALTRKDNESLTPLDLCSRDHLYMPFVQTNKEIGSYSVYTWGDNSSYTLGHGKESRSLLPEIIDTFKRRDVSITKALLRRYHSVHLTADGAVFTCGHGRGGRLGLGHESPTLHPMQVKLPQVLQSVEGGSGDGPDESTMSTLRIEAIAAGSDHTLLLGANGRAYSFGSNEHRQLGIDTGAAGKQSEPKMMNAKVLMKGPAVTHIAAGTFHSVVATATSVYTLGLNAGQLGFAKGDKYLAPRLVSSLSNQSNYSTVQLVECSDAATIVVMPVEKKGGFYVLHKYATRHISFRGAKFERTITTLCVTGGQLDHAMLPDILQYERGSSPLKVYWINQVGQLFQWTEDDGGAIRKITCAGLGRQLSMLDMCASLRELLVTTEEGGVYILTASEKSLTTPRDSQRLPSAVATLDMKVKRISGVHRATYCSIDPLGNNYAVLQAKEYTVFFAEIGPSKVSEEYAALYETADQLDGTCDVVLECGGERFPCHKFILASRSAFFSKLLTTLAISSTEDTSAEDLHHFPTSEVQELSIQSDVRLLEFILKYIYTGCVDLTSILDLDDQLNSAQGSKANKSKPLNAAEKNARQQQERQSKLSEIGKMFGVKSLALNRGKPTAGQFSYMMSKFADWCDVILTSSDDREIRCHKCVLVARMEYFQTMLTGHWYEGQDRIVRLELSIPYDILSAVIHYIYTDETYHLKGGDIEFTVNVLVVADQLLLTRLKEICESLIVSQLTVDNVTQVYQLAATYHTAQLKEAAMFLISLNMSEMLELSLLEDLDNELLEELTRYYRDKMRCMSRRFLGKISDGPSEDEINRVLSKADDSSSAQSKRTRRRTRTASNSSAESDPISALEDMKLDDADFAEEFAETFDDAPGSVDITAPVSQKLSANSLPDLTQPVQNGHNSEPVKKRCNAKLTQHQLATHSSPSVMPADSLSPSHQPAFSNESRVANRTPSLRDIMNQELKTGTNQQNAFSKTQGRRAGRRKYRSLDEDTSASVDKPGQVSEQDLANSKPAWSTASNSSTGMSLKEVMEREKAHVVALNTDQPPISKLKHRGANKTSWSPPKAAEKPAWNLSQTPQSSNKSAATQSQTNLTSSHVKSPPPVRNQSEMLSPKFQDIMSEEEREMKALLLYTNKPLLKVQIEESAMEELTLRYTANKKPYERITVERVTRKLAAPLWKTHSSS